MLLAGILLLGVQGALMVSLGHPEYLPSPPPLSEFSSSIGTWRENGGSNLEPAVYEMLAPDDYLNRNYADPARHLNVNLFIAYYKTQYKAKGAHDPKICLPGSGFNPIASKTIEIPTKMGKITANYYLIAKNSAKDVVVYWYQTHDRAFTGDQGLHFSRLFETFTTNRTDMALVRVVVPVLGENITPAADQAVEFVQSAYNSIMRQFPVQPVGR
jgi:EpsI family protein